MQPGGRRLRVEPSTCRPARPLRRSVILSVAGSAQSAGPAKSKDPCVCGLLHRRLKAFSPCPRPEVTLTKTSPVPANQLLLPGFPRPPKRFRQPLQKIGRNQRMFADLLSHYVSGKSVQVNRREDS